MRKQLFRLTLPCLICLSISVVASAQIVSIPDFNLRAVIANKLGKAPGAAITVADMAWITDLDGTNRNIRNLTGLEHATNLIRLWLPKNNITDLRPLSGLTRLIELDLLSNTISDISPLARLINLRGLYLRDNYIFDLSPLVGLTQLKYLNLGENRIFNILFLRGLTQLEELGLWTNSIADISPLARLINLRLLDLGENVITNISALAGLINLSKLWVDNNSISDLSPLVANTGLRNGDTVDVNRNPLNNASVNSHIPTLRSRGVTVELERILVQQNAVNIPDPNLRNAIEQVLRKARGATITVADMQTLDALYAANENIRNLTGLETATNLRELGLEANFISDLSPISGLTNLTFLHLRNNSVSNISPIARLTRLTFLHIGTNRISNISPLAGLIKLTALGAGHNNITDISPLARLTNLARVGLHNNSISNISPLAGLTQLTELHLHNNAISDLWPLVANTGLWNGDSVDVSGNPLSALSFNTHIPTLQSRGVTVAFDNIVVPPRTVNIPDPNLRNAIQRVLRKARGATITVADMATLQTLYATSENIRNLTGLEHATSLRELGLAANSISNISTIARLTNLTSLDLRDNLISNISPLTGLTNLTALGLGQNNITNISPLAGLTRLTALNLWNNFISNISPLARLTNLTALRLDSNFISDISPLARLTRLTELYLENNAISDLWPLVANTGLGNGDTVEVTGNPLSTVSFTTHLPTLRSRGVTVKFDQVQVVVPPPPQSVNIPDPNIRHAIRKALGKARDAAIRIEDMARLTELEVTRKTITNLTGLEHATNLTRLVLRNNAIADISPLAGLTQLTFLHLGSNRISNISLLARLTQLRQLYLEKNTISNISPLAGLTDLTTLELGHNNIRDISPLARLTKLAALGLHNNSISNISPLERLTKLTELYLHNNSISDLWSLVANTGLRSGDKLNVRGNPLGDRSFSTHIPTLQSRGVNVESDQIVVSSKTVNIPDPNLRNAIEQMLGKARGATITVSDMQTLAALYATSENITNLTGLEAAINLRELGLVDNNITDISPLAGLTKLRLLWLDDNSISDISAIAGLINLSELRLLNNSISNISPLVANTGLGSADWIDLRGNFLNNTAFNTHIPTLQSRGIVVEFDQIVVPPKMVNIPDPNLRNAIEKVFGKTPGATITVVDMETLTTLNATNKNIRNLTGLETATNLTELDLQNNFISNLSHLSKLTKLQRLYLQDNSISDLSYLVGNIGLGNGDTVNLKENPISTISINTYIPTLQSRGVNVQYDAPPKTVNIPDTKLRNIIETTLRKAPGATITVADMERLTNLDGTNKNITNLTGIEHATNLENLLLINTNITDLSPLARLAKLHYLDIADNSISDISPLAKLTRLGYLNLADNSVSDISLVAELHQLSYLNLENNSISDISSIVENTKLGDGHEIYLNGNPLSALSINTHLPTLQSRKVIVEFDDTVTRPADVNGDGVVNIFDLVSAVSRFGKQGQNITADVNGDGTVNILDLVVIAGMFDGAAAAPSAQPQGTLTVAEVRGWLTDARALEVKDPIMKRGIMMLEQLLISLTPTETKLLPNYPNPFNPETWIPYRLAEDAFVTLTIYDGAGQVVRTIDLGHQTAAAYESRSKAIYWDGRNQVGESVASGVYFYHLSAGNFSATRKMLILK